MPSQGEYQKPAGIDISPAMKPLGKRVTVSRNSTIKPTLEVDNCTYKGNPVLNANR